MTSQLRRLWACLGKVRRRPTAIPMKASEAGPSLTQNRSYLDDTGQRDPLRDIQLLDFEHRRANHCPRQRPAATAWDLFLPHCAPSIPHPPSAWLPLRALTTRHSTSIHQTKRPGSSAPRPRGGAQQRPRTHVHVDLYIQASCNLYIQTRGDSRLARGGRPEVITLLLSSRSQTIMASKCWLSGHENGGVHETRKRRRQCHKACFSWRRCSYHVQAELASPRLGRFAHCGQTGSCNWVRSGKPDAGPSAIGSRRIPPHNCPGWTG